MGAVKGSHPAVFLGVASGVSWAAWSGVVTRPDQLLMGEMAVALWVNAAVLVLLLPYSWLLLRRIQFEHLGPVHCAKGG